MTALIEARGITKRFGRVTALAELDLSLPSGRMVAILGPNGAGKTTFVRTVATLARPDAGSLTVAGHDVVREARTVRRMIGLAGQSAAVEEMMTGAENLAMVARLYGQSRRSARAASGATLEQLGLAEAGSRLVKTYSGGMRRRLDLGASLVGAPRLLLLDEPTTGLDPRSRIELWEAIVALGERGTDVLLTTQYLDEADHLASLIVIIDGGRVVAQGSPAELKQRVGADVLDLHTREASTLVRAADVLQRLGVGTPAIDPDTKRCSIDAPKGSGVLALVVRALDDAGIDIEDITVRQPTLDEVFLKLTDRPRAPDSATNSHADADPRSDTHAPSDDRVA
jgi:ABC-2 type transport system ATP-binding protein